MKTMRLILLATFLVVSISTKAQVSVDVNFGKPPVWAPRNAEVVQYYYLPEIETYYDVPSKRYIYLRNGKWFRSAALPAHYRSYNLRNGRIVYLNNYRGNAPYTYFGNHKVKYGKGSYKPKFYKGNNGNGNKNVFNKGVKNNKGQGRGNGKGNK